MLHYEDNDIKIEEKDDILICTFQKDVIVSKAVSSKMISKRIEYSKGKDRHVISDARKIRYWTFSSRNNDMKEHGFKLISKAAIIVKKGVSGTLYEFAIKLFPPPVTLRPFYNFEDAFNWLKSEINKDAIFKTIQLGLPIGISIVIEMSLFSGSGILIAKFGQMEAGAHAVAITVASLSFMIYMGIGQGITIRASQLMGAQETEKAWFAIKSGAFLNLLISVFVCLLFIFLTEPLIRLFSSDEKLIPLAITLLYFGAAFQIVDSLQVSAIFGLRAYHDTVSPPKFQFIAFWIFGIPIGAYLAFNDTMLGLSGAKGMWFAMIVSLLVVGVLLLIRLKEVAKGKSQIKA